MATIEKGQFFLDHQALKLGKEDKAKFFICLTDGDIDDDRIVCFVLNTEERMDLYHVGCNKGEKFILYNEIHKFKFLVKPSAIMLSEPCCYFVKEFYEDNILILDDKADEILCRQIRNCIDDGYLIPAFKKLLDDTYKKKN